MSPDCFVTYLPDRSRHSARNSPFLLSQEEINAFEHQTNACAI